jgi:hypothetical protein
MTRKTYSLVGAGVGLASFLALGLLPALLYGGYAGVMLASGLLGAPVQATPLVRGLVVLGMVLGVLAAGALFTIGGAAAGAAVGALVGAPARREAREKAKTQA